MVLKMAKISVIQIQAIASENDQHVQIYLILGETAGRVEEVKRSYID